ncbi:Cysteine-rich receptor-like protein kinase 10 [Hordeum vulgare]|nr:Cysteine-rich receptor-like protein kinase 10 [Hordeum vulgare]
MNADNETSLKWAWNNCVWEEVESQRRALEEITARRRGREEGDGVILDDNDEEAPGLLTVFATVTEGRGAAKTIAEGRTTTGRTAGDACSYSSKEVSNSCSLLPV